MNTEPQSIVNLTRGSVVCERVLVADRPLRRMRGLMGRRSLPVGDGLLLKPAPSIHTGFMRFPIDVVFLDQDLHVVKRVEGLAPWRAASARGARAVLELAAGEVARSGVETGDLLDIIAAPAAAGAPGSDTTAVEAVSNGDEATRPSGDAGSTRLLLITTDGQFRAAVAGVFKRRGYSVTLGERMERVVERAKRDAADVVILDANGAPDSAAREAARIKALFPPVGVVILAEDVLDGAPTGPVVSRWGSIDDFLTAVQRARLNRTRRSS